MEIVDKGDDPGADLVQVAFAETREEAALIRGLLREEAGIRSLSRQGALQGPSLGTGLLTQTSRRIFVSRAAATRARELLAEVMVEDPLEAEIPEPANAAYLADATGRRPRDYDIFGAYARIWLLSAAFLAIALGAFLLFR